MTSRRDLTIGALVLAGATVVVVLLARRDTAGDPPAPVPRRTRAEESAWDAGPTPIRIGAPSGRTKLAPSRAPGISTLAPGY